MLANRISIVSVVSPSTHGIDSCSNSFNTRSLLRDPLGFSLSFASTITLRYSNADVNKEKYWNYHREKEAKFKRIHKLYSSAVRCRSLHGMPEKEERWHFSSLTASFEPWSRKSSTISSASLLLPTNIK